MRRFMYLESRSLSFPFLSLGVALISAVAAAAPSSARADQPTRERLQEIFHQTSEEFGVPVQVLQGVAFVETRWNQVAPEEPGEAGEQEHPPVYGVMGLRDDEWFGHSLKQAAALIHESPEALKADPALNIRGTAALLASFVSGPVDAADPLTWVQAVRKLSGIPQDRESAIYIHDVYEAIRKGFNRERISIQPVPLAVPGFAERADEAATGGTGGATATTPAEAAASGDSLAIDWDPSPNFFRGAIDPKVIVIHDTEGSYAGAISWLKAPVAQASAHFVIRSSDGKITQLVRETDRAWHARCWNRIAIGIEHEGFVSEPRYFTGAMYESSARLVRRLAARFGIPVDDTHIIGHGFGRDPRFSESPVADIGNCNTHHDPGTHWDWARYFGLLGAGETPLN